MYHSAVSLKLVQFLVQIARNQTRKDINPTLIYSQCTLLLPTRKHLQI